MSDTRVFTESSAGLGSGESVVDVVGVTKNYGAMAAVDNVSMSIGKEFFSLLGPSGSGKTTLLRIIAGFSGIDAGKVMIAGRDVSRVPPHKRPCNTVFQQYALFPHLSVAGNIAFGLRERKVPKREIEAKVGSALELVHLSGSQKKYPQQLSGGQQQRVALARVLVNEPKVLLLDEPLAALDAKLRKDMQIELKRLQQEVGISFIYVTHDQEEALVMSDRLAIMSAGNVQQIGTPVEVYDNPSSTFVADFIGQSNLITADVVASKCSGSQLRFASGECVEVPLVGLRVGSRGELMIRPEDVVVSRADPGKPTPVLSGRIAGQVFLGAGRRVEVALPDNTRLVAVMDRRVLGDLAAGDQVSIAWTPERARFFPRLPEEGETSAGTAGHSPGA